MTDYIFFTNFHVLKVKFYGPTNTKGARFGITSERFEQRVVVDYDYLIGDTVQQAALWLQEKSFNIVGKGEGKDHYYIITDTFEPLKN